MEKLHSMVKFRQRNLILILFFLSQKISHFEVCESSNARNIEIQSILINNETSSLEDEVTP